MNRLTRIIIGLYPTAWKKRYGDELDALIEDSGVDWRVLFDLLKEYSGKLSELTTRARDVSVGVAKLKKEASRFLSLGVSTTVLNINALKWDSRSLQESIARYSGPRNLGHRVSY